MDVESERVVGPPAAAAAAAAVRKARCSCENAKRYCNIYSTTSTSTSQRRKFLLCCCCCCFFIFIFFFFFLFQFSSLCDTPLFFPSYSSQMLLLLLLLLLLQQPTNIHCAHRLPACLPAIPRHSKPNGGSFTEASVPKARPTTTKKKMLCKKYCFIPFFLFLLSLSLTHTINDQCEPNIKPVIWMYMYASLCKYVRNET